MAKVTPTPARTRTTVPTRAPRPQTTIKVRALADCYYDEKYRRAGDVFAIDAKPRPGGDPTVPAAFSPRYMERVDGATPEKITSHNEALRRQHDEVMAGRSQPGLQTDIDNPTGSEGVLGDD